MGRGPYRGQPPTAAVRSPTERPPEAGGTLREGLQQRAATNRLQTHQTDQKGASLHPTHARSLVRGLLSSVVYFIEKADMLDISNVTLFDKQRFRDN